jgi:hypothetical protein
MKLRLISSLLRPTSCSSLGIHQIVQASPRRVICVMAERMVLSGATAPAEIIPIPVIPPSSQADGTPSSLNGAFLMRQVLDKMSSLPEQSRLQVQQVLFNFLAHHNSMYASPLLEDQVVAATDIFITMVSKGDGKLQTRKDLTKASEEIFDMNTRKPDALVASLILASLACSSASQALRRSAASALSATIRQKRKNQTFNNTTYIAEDMVFALVQMANSSPNGGSDKVDLHILTSLAKCLDVQDCKQPQHSKSVAQLVEAILETTSANNGQLLADDNAEKKVQIAAALSLAAQLRPWKMLSPSACVNAAIPFDLWHAAESVCTSTIGFVAQEGVIDDKKTLPHLPCQTLVDAAIDLKMYRMADTYATKFYNTGGSQRFMEARYLHACDTIVKVIRKRVMTVIEKQVERVDQTVGKIVKEQQGGGNVSTNIRSLSLDSDVDLKVEIRNFALRQLEESGDVDSAHRLATLWDMEYVYDEKTLQAALEARRQKYLQWEDMFPESSANVAPDFLSTPEALAKAFKELRLSSKDKEQIYGFDVEWSDDSIGAALLQVSTMKCALLIDIPALAKSQEGVEALKQTVGLLFAEDDDVKVVGFCCKQDLSKLRAAPTFGGSPWLTSSKAMMDLQSLIAKDQPTLGKLGLSRCCDFYLGKPLDKSEQCSLWTKRPLSREQRVYGALDAYVCVAIYNKIKAITKTEE